MQIELKPQPEFLVLLDRLVEALERNNELLNIRNNQGLGEHTRKYSPGTGRPAKFDKGKICALYEAGWTYQQIADEVGCSHSYVGAVLINHYGTSKRRKPEDEDHD